MQIRIRVNELIWALVILLMITMAHIGCSANEDDEPDDSSICGPYPDRESSPWILPYSPGRSFELTQGNCSNFSHLASVPAAKYAYDFGMPIGTPLIATRPGTVHNLSEDGPDGTGLQEDTNFIQIRHDDGSVVEYAHLTTNGALFNINQFVRQGDTIALSGNSGRSTGPHLHYVVWRQVGDATSIPISFINTIPHPNGLRKGIRYVAKEF